MKIYKLIGVILLLLALCVIFPAVFGAMHLTGIGVGLILFCGLGGMALICS